MASVILKNIYKKYPGGVTISIWIFKIKSSLFS